MLDVFLVSRSCFFASFRVGLPVSVKWSTESAINEFALGAFTAASGKQLEKWAPMLSFPFTQRSACDFIYGVMEASRERKNFTLPVTTEWSIKYYYDWGADGINTNHRLVLVNPENSYTRMGVSLRKSELEKLLLALADYFGINRADLTFAIEMGYFW